MPKTELRRWALITGAGSGIGAELACALAARDVGVVLVGRRRDRLERTRERIGQAAPTLLLDADIGRAEDRALLLAKVSEGIGSGRLGCLVHNAGIGDPGPDFAGTDGGQLERAFAVNVTAPLELTQGWLDALRADGDARVLFVGAGIADRAQPGTGVYGISKKALARLFEQIVVDLDREARPGTPAVALFQPGMVDTEGLRAHVAHARACGLPHAEYLEQALADGSARRAEDVGAAMARALLDVPRAAFHGQVLRPDEGGSPGHR